MTVEWKAIYNDGTELPQYNEDGSENKYPDIDRSKLIQFVLLYFGIPHVVIHLDDNKRLIYRRRVAQSVTKGIIEVVYLAGWQEKIKRKNVQMICFLFEDGHVEIVDRFYEKHPWFYSIVFRPEERI